MKRHEDRETDGKMESRIQIVNWKLRGSNGKVARTMGQLDRQTQRKKAEAVRHGAGPGKMHAPVGSLFSSLSCHWKVLWIR